jgi:hypothetical protein
LGAILAGIATIVILLLGGAFAAPYVIDWNNYKDVFQTQASRLIGRKVEVNGGVNLKILPTPQIRFENVRIADENGGFETPFARAQSFDMMLSLSGLLTGAVDAESVSLVKPVVRFAVDEDGRGNWLGLGPEAGDTLAPREVVFKRVEIEDGVIEVLEAGRGEPWRVNGVTGALGADSVEGPFKFQGSFAVDGARYDVRAGTGKASGGRLPVKGAVQAGAQWTFDGLLSNLRAIPEFEGAVSAAWAGPNALEAKGQVKLSSARVQVSDMTLSVSDETRPQLLTGGASFEWGAAPRYEIELSGDWFNLDPHLTGAAEGAFGAAKASAAALRRALGGRGEGRVRLSAASLNLRGEDIRNASLDMMQQGDVFDIALMKFSAPGDSDIKLFGRLTGAGDQIQFDGEMEAAASNLSRFSKWAGAKAGQHAALVKNFSIKGRLALDAGKVHIAGAAVELGDQAFTADAAYEFAGAGKLALVIEGERLDLREWASLDLDFAGLLGSDADETAENPTLGSALAHARQFDDFRLKVKAGVIDFSTQQARDVAVDAVAAGDSITVNALTFSTADGIQMNATAKLQALDSAPDGEVQVSLDANTTEAVARLHRAAGFSAGRAEALAPLKIAGGVKARGSAGAIDFKFDGVAAQSPFSVDGRVENETGSLLRGGLSLNATASNADGAKLMAQLFPGWSAKPANTQPGTLTIAARGKVDDGVSVQAAARGGGLSVQGDGRVFFAVSPWEASGAVRVQTDAAASESVFALIASRKLAVPALSLIAAVEKRRDTYTFTGVTLGIDGATASGSATLKGGDKPAVTLTLDADHASGPKLFAALLDTPRGPSDPGAWPDAPLALSGLGERDYAFTLNARSLLLTTGLAVANAQLTAALRRGTLTVTRLDGDLYGGRLAAEGELENERGRYALRARVALQNAALESVFNAGGPLASGPVSLDARLNGEGLSPRGLMSSLSGKGKISLGGGVFYRFSPVAPERLAAEHLGAAEPPKQALAPRLVSLMRQGDFPFKRMRAPFIVRDGAIIVRRASFRGPDTIVRSQIEVDLSTLALDSEWRIGAPVSRRSAKAPPVTVVFAGPLAQLTALKPVVDTAELERFLAVKRMERDMERLERLNRYGATPEPEPAPLLGPRLDKTKPRDGVERQPLPPVPGAPQRGTDPQAWKPSTESVTVEPKQPGAFDAKIRSVLGSQTPGANAGGTPLPPQQGSAAGQGTTGTPGSPPGQSAEKPRRPLNPNDPFSRY